MSGTAAPTPGAFFRLYIHGVLKTSGEAEISNVLRALEELEQVGAQAGRGFDSGFLYYYLGAIALASGRGSRDHPAAIGMLSYGNRPGEEFDLSHLDELIEQVENVMDKISKLNCTPAMAVLRQQDAIPGNGAFAGFPADSDEAIGPLLGLYQDGHNDPYLLQLIETVKLVRRRAENHVQSQQPVVDIHLSRLCNYIYRTTGGWRDQLLVDLLGPLKVMHCGSASELKQWRYDQHRRRARSAAKTATGG